MAARTWWKEIENVSLTQLHWQLYDRSWHHIKGGNWEVQKELRKKRNILFWRLDWLTEQENEDACKMNIITEGTPKRTHQVNEDNNRSFPISSSIHLQSDMNSEQNVALQMILTRHYFYSQAQGTWIGSPNIAQMAQNTCWIYALPRIRGNMILYIVCWETRKGRLFSCCGLFRSHCFAKWDGGPDKPYFWWSKALLITKYSELLQGSFL